ncbi:hypothetical protein [Microbacterium sp.]|uniref:hypothetical protein n=1 Tax=Microbacterium sp. TaxID=51671 RepID=UPI0027338049|nr:hypothetical protein [Microbacterium sp.]MDP3949636.1 hypothetical protein [Microbacterium sp.]
MLSPTALDPVELVIELGGVVRTQRLKTHRVSRTALERGGIRASHPDPPRVGGDQGR